MWDVNCFFGTSKIRSNEESNTAAATLATSSPVDELNFQYSDTSHCPDNEPGYYCNGLLVRMLDRVGQGDDPSQNGIMLGSATYPKSFSYVRSDTIDMDTVPFYPTGGAGMIFYPISKSRALDKDDWTSYCIFAIDASTSNREHFNCGYAKDVSGAARAYTDYSYCSDVGVQTAAQYYTFAKSGGGGVDQGFQRNQCSLRPNDEQAFSVMIDAQHIYMDDQL